MTINELLHAGNAIYGYDEDDKRILRELSRTDPAGLRLSLESDPLILQKIMVQATCPTG